MFLKSLIGKMTVDDATTIAHELNSSFQSSVTRPSWITYDESLWHRGKSKNFSVCVVMNRKQAGKGVLVYMACTQIFVETQHKTMAKSYVLYMDPYLDPSRKHTASKSLIQALVALKDHFGRSFTESLHVTADSAFATTEVFSYVKDKGYTV